MSSMVAQDRRFMPMVIVAWLTLVYAMSGLLGPDALKHATPSYTLFVPAAIALAAALRFGPAVWPGVFLGHLLLGQFADVSFVTSAALAGINSVAAVVGVTLFRKFKGDASLASMRDLFLLLGVALCILQPFTAAASALALHWLNKGPLAPFPQLLLHYGFSNALAQVIVTPLLLSIVFQRKSDQWVSFEMAALTSLVMVVCWLILIDPQVISRVFSFGLLMPILTIIALRCGLGPACAAALVVAYATLLLDPLSADQVLQASPAAHTDLTILLLGLVPAVQAIAILSRQQLKSQNQLKHVHHQYEQVFQRAPALVNGFDQDGRCVIWSDECARVFGYSREAVMAHPDPLSLFYPDPVDRERMSLARQQPDPRGTQGEWQPLRSDGTPLTSLWTRVPISENLTVNIGMDITERKQAEARLRIAASVFEYSYDGIFIINPDKTIANVNPAGTQLLGYRAKELLGSPIEMHRPKGYSQKLYDSLWENVAKHDSWQGEIMFRHRTDGKRPFRTTVFTVRDNDHSILRYITVFTDISELKAKEAQLQRMAHFDSLTGLPNRYLLHDRLNQAINNAKRSNTLMAMCYLDLDGFKEINDDMGHEAGDAVLIEVAHRIQTILRRKDTVARLGGDEMALLLTNLSHPDDSLEVLDRVLESVSQPIFFDEASAQISASIGVSFFHLDGDSFDVLLSKADTAMYQAKRSGKNRYCFYTASDHLDAVTTS